MPKFFSLFILAFFSHFFCGCTPNSYQDFRKNGEEIISSLIIELKNIHSRDELIQSSKKIQKLFNELSDLMIAGQEFAKKNKTSTIPKIDSDLSDQLKNELRRIYAIEGCQKLMEKCQEQALLRLNAYYKK